MREQIDWDVDILTFAIHSAEHTEFISNKDYDLKPLLEVVLASVNNAAARKRNKFLEEIEQLANLTDWRNS